MEPAGGTPGWEAGVSAQTRGPGARQEVQTRERETNGHGGNGGLGVGGHRQYTVGVCLPALQSPAFQEEAELCWVKGREAEGESSTREATGQGPVPRCVTCTTEPGRAEDLRNAQDTGHSYRGLGGGEAMCVGRPGRPLHHGNTQHHHRNAVRG